MPDEVDSLVLQASVVDDFSDTLDELSNELLALKGQYEEMNPMDFEGRAMDLVQTVAKAQSALATLPDEKTIDIEADWDYGSGTGDFVFPIDNAGHRGPGLHESPNIGEDTGDFVFPLDDGVNLEDIKLFTDERAPSSRMNAAERAMNRDLVGAPRRELVELANRPDHAGPNLMDDDGRDEKRSVLRRGFDKMANWRVTMGKLMNLFAALIPALAVFVGALPAAVGGLVALAGAALAVAGVFGAIGGLGLLGIVNADGSLEFARLQQRINSLGKDFLAAFDGVADNFIPVIDTATQELRGLFFELASVASRLSTLTDDANAGLRAIANILPSVVEDAIIFAETALPAISAIVTGIGGIQIFSIFAEMLAETLPLIVSIGNAVMTMLPAIYQMSYGFLVVANVLANLLGLLAWASVQVPFLTEGLGVLAATLLTLATVSSLYTLVTGGLIGRMLTLALTALPAAISTTYSWIAANYGAVAANLAVAASVVALTVALGALVGMITLGLGPAIGALMGGFTGVDNRIQSATDSLRSFNRQARNTNLGGFGDGTLAGPSSGGQYRDPSTTVVAPDQETANAAANTISFHNGYGGARTVDEDDVQNNNHS